MPVVSTNYPDCYECCACASGYLTSVFGKPVTSGSNIAPLCDNLAVRSAPVHFLAEFKIDKSAATFPSTNCKNAIPDSFKAKFTSGYGVYGPYKNVLDCNTSMKACTGLTYGSIPSHPDFKLHDGLYSIFGWFSNAAPPFRFSHGFRSFNTEVFSVNCDSSEIEISAYQPGAMPSTSYQCTPFSVVFDISTYGSVNGLVITVKYTLTDDCSDPYAPAGPTPVPPTPSPPPPTPAELRRVTIPCIHIGDNIEDPATCGCGTAVLRKCGIHGQCRKTGYPKAGESICLTCPDYQSP